MRNKALHDALRDFALESAAALGHELREGGEIPFVVVEEPGGGTVLYRYQPLTSEFITERWHVLRGLPAFAAAANALGSGAENYLRVHGVPGGADPEPALHAMLDRLYEDATGFDFPEERFERVYGEVERALLQDTVRTAVVAPLYGVELERERVDLGDGLFLIAGDKLEAPSEAVWREQPGTAPPERANVLCVLRRDVATGDGLPVSEARIRFRKLITAMRLFKAGGLSFGPIAWGRLDEGAWQPLPLGGGGAARGAPWNIAPGEELELVEFLELIGGARMGGRIAWALTRFEMGCERARDEDALSDYLLALRALLDGGDEAGRASLTLRLAALCAEEDERRPVRRRLELTFALERWLMAGGAGDAYLDEVGADSPRSLVLGLEEHLRALLRDVLCGYLEPDLKAAADDILLASGDPIEIRAADLRQEPARERRFVSSAPPPPPPPPPPAEVEPDRESELEPEAEADTRETDAIARDDLSLEEHAEEAGVTPSADWEWDEDPASYSAPV